VDGKVVTRPGTKADPNLQQIALDGRPLKFQRKTYLMLNKPAGPITSLSDPEGRPVVMALLQEVKEALRPVGRLDAATEGLLLFTNDGALAYRLTHPKWGVEKVYQAEVQGRPNAATLRRLRKGIPLEEGVTTAARVRLLPRKTGRAIVELVIHTGWRQQVRRMLAAVEHPVVRLRRVQLGPLALGHLPPAKWRRLNPGEVAALWRAVETPAERPQTLAGGAVRTGRTTLPALKQEAHTRIRRGVRPTRTRTF
jgi:23S rRNA pseudouridine2605 synthase